ncbi:hypothetical protein CHS0354_003376 [Potamilus streckersoni]|uniref:SAM domain-containing protein n=1 Tax=Potamilus streckersoni TaxID=2493646 RepID=A0AAE0SUJ4_9BIVA|nr:hypothetical protein CHS0354_003376 [Potamilus streckersoni]
MTNVRDWNCEDVKQWLISNSFEGYADLFCDQHKIDGKALLALEESDLREPPMQIRVLGDVKHLSLAIQILKLENQDKFNVSDPTNGGLKISHRYSKRVHSRPLKHSAYRQDSTSTFSDDDDVIDEEIEKIISRKGCYSRNLDSELFKTALSFVYVFFVFLLTSFVMVVVHDRVPDMHRYPPLPDLFLDNMPVIPWAFEVCELVGSVLFTVWTIILFFHKHRFILMRRMFSLLGTVFLLRCVTMLITSLSVPGVHLHCQGQKYPDMWAKFQRTYEIWSGFGMSLQGVRSCGDYMFSGHTVCITMLNFFITEYTPRRIYMLHTFTWVANIFGIFFILAAHEHYSIDVFIAFYITSRLFLYYHTLANNRSLMLRDMNRRRVWFPLFSYFESKCDGIVPNEFEWPLLWPKSFCSYFERKRKKHLN